MINELNAKELSRRIIDEALDRKASDIHFIPEDENVHVYFRVQGLRVFSRSLPLPLYNKLLTFLKFSSEMDIGEMKLPQNGKLSYLSRGLSTDLRLSTLPLSSTESLAIRLFSVTENLSIGELFLFPEQMKRVMKWIGYTSGLVLFTGPTGCGKSTTLYALMEILAQKGHLQLITLEDPVERSVPGVIQVQVNEKNAFDYNEGLKAALRHDPDIIIVGELRDEATAHFAVRAALSGHLVFSTLHAKNALGTIRRLQEMNIPKVDLEQTLRAVASQKLLLSSAIKRRVAILEILEDAALSTALKGSPPVTSHTFPHLKKKAWAYGFI
ncbi:MULTISPECIES: competence type IV pilus ATPase ComGA [Salimicrobium]|uniref:competence type IV pilus ATPase ComGA n=1 Tax=Salimicrobium TaxID=351195 RepID=UPI001F35EA81|nr:competence type IV pilus ATPase ComGA [Salimicrobium salexigens]MBM7695906.1 competence protein ComGA [Salimicrobium jeotgali]